jgi:hypothetical protein
MAGPSRAQSQIAPPAQPDLLPPAVNMVCDTGRDPALIIDLILKIIYLEDYTNMVSRQRARRRQTCGA